MKDTGQGFDALHAGDSSLADRPIPLGAINPVAVIPNAASDPSHRSPLGILLLAVLLNALLFFGVFAFGEPAYETNDDLMMMLIASGFYTGEPSEYLVFSHVGIGWILRLLYEWRQDLNWHFCYLVGVHFASFVALAFILLRRRCTTTTVVLYIALFLIVEVRNLINLQFTTTAFAAGTAGLLLCLDAWHDGARTWLAQVAGGVILVTLMVAIREEAALLLLAVSVPFVWERIRVVQWWRPAIVLGVCGVLAFCFHVTQNAYYNRHPGWSSFLEYNRLRSQIHDTVLGDHLPASIPGVPWSANDLWMFRSWSFSEPLVYGDVRVLQLCVGNWPREPDPERFSIRNLGILSVLSGDAGSLMGMTLVHLLAYLMLAPSHRKRAAWTLFCSYWLILFMLLHLKFSLKLPGRVAYNIPFFLNCLCLYWVSTIISSGNRAERLIQPLCLFARRRWNAFCIFCFGIGCVAYYAWSAADLTRSVLQVSYINGRLKELSKTFFDPLNSLTEDPEAKPLLVPIGFAYSFERCLAYRANGGQFPFRMVPGGWLTHSPIFYQFLEQHHLQPYSLSIIARPEVFLLMQPSFQNPLRRFYDEHYDLNVDFERIAHIDFTTEFQRSRNFLYKGRFLMQ